MFSCSAATPNGRHGSLASSIVSLASPLTLTPTLVPRTVKGTCSVNATQGKVSDMCWFLMSRLQSVQNAAARLITGTRCGDHITPVLRLLHCMVTSTPARRFQGCHTCSSVAVRKFCVILSWRHSSCCRRSWATTIYREPDMRRYPDPQHLWWQRFCRSRAMKQFTATSQRCWPTVQSVPAVIKDIFV